MAVSVLLFLMLLFFCLWFAVQSLVFSSSLLVSGSKDGSVCVWSALLHASLLSSTLHSHVPPFETCASSQNIVICSNGIANTFPCRQAASGELAKRLSFGSAVESVALSPDGSRIIAVGSEQLLVWSSSGDFEPKQTHAVKGSTSVCVTDTQVVCGMGTSVCAFNAALLGAHDTTPHYSCYSAADTIWMR